jgi:thiosulfate/3-mercaptopyruvate sulfurtransferase
MLTDNDGANIADAIWASLKIAFLSLRTAGLKFLRYVIVLCVAGCVLPAQRAMAAEDLKGNLVSVDWLEKNMNNADVLVLDASPGQIYATRHIPGALTVDFLAFGYPERTTAEMEQRYQSWGISPGRKIVIYDQGGSYFATRLFYSLYYHGYPAKDLFVLNGGLSKWQAQGLPVTKDVTPAPVRGSFRIVKINEDARVRLPEYLAASGDPANNVLLEALSPETHFGETVFLDRPGHVPNARMLPTDDYFNADKTFKSPDEIRRMLTYLGIRPEQQIYTSCGGGVAASVPFFAVKFMLNYPKVALYTESQMGWMSDERELPVWTYDAPSLMRETNWLSGWSSKMLRMYGAARVSVVDVRSADEFKEGHVPFALNIPASVFRSNINDPDKLAKILGPAGVDASHEAVVVSGAGLTKDSALAFAILEEMGQKRVSVFMDSVDKWRQAGFTVATSATTVGPKTNPFDLSIPPISYPENFRKDVIIANPDLTRGIYPKVFIASGKNLPARVEDGKVIHLPYTKLLNADGTPKAAKDIWNILTKAGIPRYAEIVCFSDDPGEAAANYFILKLMGYPDIKMLVI